MPGYARDPTDPFSPGYNQRSGIASTEIGRDALHRGTRSLEELYERVQEAGATIVDPVADRPLASSSSRSIIIMQPVTFWKANNKKS